MTQEKLEQRLTEYRDRHYCSSSEANNWANIVHCGREFAILELQKAVEIAHNAIGATRHEIADEIRKLME